MDYYNTNRATLGRDEKVNQLMAQVEDMKTVLGRNIQLMLEREHKVNSLLETSEQARKDSLVFRKKSIYMKRQQRAKNRKLWCLIAGILLVIVYTIITTFCGFRLQKCISSDEARRLEW